MTKVYLAAGVLLGCIVPHTSSFATILLPPYLPKQDVLLSYTAVGIFEEWELSMELFDAVISSPVQQWGSGEAVNPGPQSGQREMLLRWAHSSPEIRQAVGGDLLLYDLALSIFKRQTAEALGTVWTHGGTSLARERGAKNLRAYH